MKKITLILFAFLSNIILLNDGKIYSQQFTEYEVKAAYVFNFAKFIEWPDSCFDSGASPIILGVYGEDPFGDVLQKTFENRMVNGRKWKIIYIKSLPELQKCHIIFISKAELAELYKILNFSHKNSILTIGDNINNFCQNGGIINFTPQLSKHRFEINNGEAKKINIIISSKLLILSKIIRSNEIKF